jgi:hypothetical protein
MEYFIGGNDKRFREFSLAPLLSYFENAVHVMSRQGKLLVG